MDMTPMDDKGLPDDLQHKLEEYNRNFEQLNNFLGDDSLLEGNAVAELQAEKTREMLTKALPYAVKTLVELCTSAVSESVRLKAAGMLMDKTLGRDPTLAEEDKATALLKRLQADPVISEVSEGTEEFIRENLDESSEA